MIRIEEFNLCTKLDDFVREKCIWIVHLSDGRKIYQDDYRPHIQPASAWIRLREYINHVSGTGISIEKFILKFRSNIVPIFDKKSAYLYSRGIMRDMTSSKSGGFHVVGEPGVTDLGQACFHCTSYSSPSLQIIKKDTRLREKCSDEQIIFNN